MSAKLECGGNLIEILDFKHSLKDEMSGNPYNCFFKIKIVSGNFSGLSSDCECDYKELKKFIEQLNNLIKCKTNKVVFQEIVYGGTISFIGDGLGHIEVAGVIYGPTMSHSLKFKFMTDQTVYSSFIKDLQRL